MKYLILVLTLLSSFAFAKFDFTIDIKPGGEFKINTNLTINKQVDVAKVYFDLFIDKDNQKLANEDLLDQTISRNLKHDLYNPDKYSYKLSSELEKLGFTAIVKNDCNLIVEEKSINSICKITSSKAGILGTLFEWGKTNIVCQTRDNKTSCTINITGKPKSKNLVLVSRTSDRLAVSGSSKTVKDLYSAFNIVSTGSATKPKNDTFFKNNLLNLWDNMFEKLDGNEKLKSNLGVSSNIEGVKINYKR
jgi:hypothetical protein